EGVMSRLTPLPLLVLMVVSSNTHSVPSAVGLQSGLKLPLVELSVHTVGLTAASKLPLLCAKATGAVRTAMAAAMMITVFFICSPFDDDAEYSGARAHGRVRSEVGTARGRQDGRACSAIPAPR